jgi:hypothetical protein
LRREGARGDHEAVRVESLPESFRSRVAVAALCLALTILIVYRSGSDIDERRDRVRARKSPRRLWDDAPEACACETLASPYSPFVREVRLGPGTRLVWTLAPRSFDAPTVARFVPFRPTLGPYAAN